MHDAARSNPFVVRDVTALERDLATLSPLVDLHTPHAEHPNRVVLFCDDEWPSSRTDPRTGLDSEVSLSELIAGHLHDGHVAVLLEAGFDRAHVTARAVAVNSRGERRVVTLSDIYPLARELGPHVAEE